MVLVRYAAMINAFDHLAVTNLDGLDDLEEIQVCTAYALDGEKLHVPPPTVEQLERCVPIYETLPG